MNFALLQPDELPQILTCWNRAVPFDQLTPKLARDKIWDDPDFDAELAIGACAGDALIGFVVGVIRRIAGGKQRGHVKLLAVMPENQGRELGSKLLSRAEAEFAERRVYEIRIDEAAPNYLNPGIDARATGAIAFFRHHGYEEFGETHNMTAELVDNQFDTASDESEMRAAGIEIRRARLDDQPAVQKLLAAHWPSWQQEVGVALEQQPISLHLATEGQQVIGFAAHSTNNVGTGWFGPMGTSPDCRGRGIGRVLLLRCLADLQSQGYQRAIIPWVGPTEFYAKHGGAAVDRTFLRFRKLLSDATD